MFLKYKRKYSRDSEVKIIEIHSQIEKINIVTFLVFLMLIQFLLVPLILPWFPWFSRLIHLSLDLFVSLSFPKVSLVDFVYFMFPIYSHLFDYLIYTDDGSQELGRKRLDL